MTSYAELYYNAYTVHELFDFVIYCKREIERQLRTLNMKENELDPDRSYSERHVSIIIEWKNKAVEKLFELLNK